MEDVDGTRGERIKACSATGGEEFLWILVLGVRVRWLKRSPSCCPLLKNCINCCGFHGRVEGFGAAFLWLLIRRSWLTMVIAMSSRSAF